MSTGYNYNVMIEDFNVLITEEAISVSVADEVINITTSEDSTISVTDETLDISTPEEVINVSTADEVIDVSFAEVLVVGGGGGGGGAWGEIIGTLSDQTDLQAELDSLQSGINSNDTDIATLQGQVANIPADGSELALGEPTDTTLADGLLPWTVNTLVTDAIDDLNEVLTALAPPPAPDLDDIDLNTTSGYDGKIALSSYAVPGIGSLPAVAVDQLFDETGNRAGVINGTTSLTGTLNEDVAEGTGSPFTPYPANSFGNANLGTLYLELNGENIHSVDLTSFVSGNDNNANGSGFNLSAATPVKFPGGTDFSQFQYRTGTWTLHYNDMVAGWNYIRVKHTVGAVTTTTDYVDCLRDTNTTATTFSAVSLDTAVGTFPWYLSGVRYWGNFSAVLRGTVSNMYKDTYWGSTAVFASNLSGNWSYTGYTLPACAGDTNKQVTVGLVLTPNNYNRFIGTDLSARLGAYRTVQSTQYSATQTLQDVLIDRYDTDLPDESNYESFHKETYRIHGGLNPDDTTFSATWVSSESLVGANGNYNNGLQQINGYLDYPYGDWDLANAPTGNPDYSAVTGERVYYRYFKDISYATANFSIYFNGSGAFISEGSSFSSSNQIKVSMRLPSQTGWMDIYNDFATDQWADGDGCKTGSGGRAMYSWWDLTVGTKNTVNSGNGVYIRITVPNAWTGWIRSISWSWSN